MTPALLARLSDGLVYSTIAVLALALLAHAASTALRSLPTRHPGASSTLSVSARGRAAGASRAAEAAGATGSTRERDATDTRAGEGPALVVGASAVSLTVLGTLLLVAGVIVRGLAAGRAPWGNMFEFLLVLSLAAGGAYIALVRRRAVREAGVWIVALMLLALGLAVTSFYTPVDDLVPVLDSYWLVIHVAAAIVSGGVFTIGAITAALGILRRRWEARPVTERSQRYVAALPTASSLDRASHAVHVFAFPVWTFAVIAGAIWAENAWGRYWGWDPKETWAFITWVFYAAYLHAQSTAGLRGSRASWFALAGYVAFLFNFFGVNLWISGLHSYAGV